MFVLRQDNTFTWPVDVKVPQDKKWDVQRFHATFKVLPQERLKEIVENEGRVDDAMLAEVFVGWSDMQDEEGNELPFSDETRKKLLDIPYVFIAVGQAYFKAVTGREFASKN